VGVRLIRSGILTRFTDELAGGVGRHVVLLGSVGDIVKGIANDIVGFFGCAGITDDAEQVCGIDDASRTRACRAVRRGPADGDSTRVDLLSVAIASSGPGTQSPYGHRCRRSKVTEANIPTRETVTVTVHNLVDPSGGQDRSGCTYRAPGRLEPAMARRSTKTQDQIACWAIFLGLAEALGSDS
jgi:hypothetical protein